MAAVEERKSPPVFGFFFFFRWFFHWFFWFLPLNFLFFFFFSPLLLLFLFPPLPPLSLAIIVAGKLDVLQTKQQQGIVEMKKGQAEAFQRFKKTLQEEIEALRVANLKDLETFKVGAKKRVESLVEKQSEETEAFSSGEFRDFADKTKARLAEEAKSSGKDVNEEELEVKFKEAVLLKDQEFELKHVNELHALKQTLLEEEERVHRGIQQKVKELQVKQQQAEHKMLADNLVAIQSTLEQHHDEQFEVKKTALLPATDLAVVDKFKEAVDQMITEREKDSEAEKEKARVEYEDLVKKIEEEAEKVAAPTPAPAPEQDKRK